MSVSKTTTGGTSAQDHSYLERGPSLMRTPSRRAPEREHGKAGQQESQEKGVQLIDHFRDEKAISQNVVETICFAGVRGLQPDPKRWTPGEVSYYLAHLLQPTLPSPVVNDLTGYIRRSLITGRTFLRLTEADLSKTGMSSQWRRILLAASRRARKEAVRKMLWGTEDTERSWTFRSDDEPDEGVLSEDPGSFMNHSQQGADSSVDQSSDSISYHPSKMPKNEGGTLRRLRSTARRRVTSLVSNFESPDGKGKREGSIHIRDSPRLIRRETWIKESSECSSQNSRGSEESDKGLSDLPGGLVRDRSKFFSGDPGAAEDVDGAADIPNSQDCESKDLLAELDEESLQALLAEIEGEVAAEESSMTSCSFELQGGGQVKPVGSDLSLESQENRGSTGIMKYTSRENSSRSIDTSGVVPSSSPTKRGIRNPNFLHRSEISMEEAELLQLASSGDNEDSFGSLGLHSRHQSSEGFSTARFVRRIPPSPEKTLLQQQHGGPEHLRMDTMRAMELLGSHQATDGVNEFPASRRSARDIFGLASSASDDDESINVADAADDSFLGKSVNDGGTLCRAFNSLARASNGRGTIGTKRSRELIKALASSSPSSESVTEEDEPSPGTVNPLQSLFDHPTEPQQDSEVDRATDDEGAIGGSDSNKTILVPLHTIQHNLPSREEELTESKSSGTLSLRPGKLVAIDVDHFESLAMQVPGIDKDTLKKSIRKIQALQHGNSDLKALFGESAPEKEEFENVTTAEKSTKEYLSSLIRLDDHMAWHKVDLENDPGSDEALGSTDSAFDTYDLFDRLRIEASTALQAGLTAIPACMLGLGAGAGFVLINEVVKLAIRGQR